MDRRLLKKAYSYEYQKRGFQIAALLHVIAIIVLFFFLSLKLEVRELEDEIQVDIYELPKQPVAKKEVIPMPEETPIPKQETPIPKKQITLQKEVTIIQPKHPLVIAKMPAAAPAEVNMQSEAVNKIADADVPPVWGAPALSTDVKLTASPESVLSPIASDIGTTSTKSYGRREGAGVKSPGKGTGTGKGLNIKSTGTGTGAGVGKIGDSIGGGSSLFGGTLKNLAEDIIQSSGGAPIDVVFVVDISGSMGDNVKAVPQHLGQMIDVYEASESDYALGLTLFTTFPTGENDIEVHPLTANVDYIKQPLYAIKAHNDENILDAIDQTVRKMRFRKNTVKHLILVSDEHKLETQQGLTADQVIKCCRENEIFLNVLGVNNQDHKRLARETGGKWHAIPEDTIAQKPPTPISNPYTTKAISKVILKDAASMPVDIILFIDGSKSMADKMPYLKQQIDFWLRDWDIALIDYRVGVVRFRAKGNVNMVNVFKLPQTQQQIHAILALPPADDENLLHAVVEGARRINIRENAKTYFIVFTDEPGDPKYPIAGTIALLKEIPVVVCVIGTADTFQQQVAQQTGGIWVAIPNANKRQQPHH